MAEEDDLLQAVLASPGDTSLRLVYADLLEEHGDPRSDYLRQELALASIRPRSRKAPPLRAALQELRRRIQPSWLALFDQPALTRANPTPFPSGWWTGEFEGFREEAGTDGIFPYESLPPLPVELFRGDFGWLRGMRKRLAAPSKASKNLERLAGEAAALSLTLPTEFGLLMGSSALRRRVRSFAGGEFNWPRRIVESPGGEGGFLVRFYSEGQWCMHWYLYLTSRGYHCVVSTGGFYGGSEYVQRDEPSNQFWFCAPSLEAFIYRIWIENEIWFTLSYDHDPLTAEEQAYLSHYKPT